MKLFSLAFSAMLAVAALPSFADGDSSAIGSSEMADVVASSAGVVLRVPIDAEGRELQSAAELRVVKNSDSSTQASELSDLWESGVDAAAATQVDSSTDSGDSSTRRGWNRWHRNNGWNHNYYNTWYRPVYYNYGYTYNYRYVNNYNYYRPSYYNGHNVWGYRYYYYCR